MKVVVVDSEADRRDKLFVAFRTASTYSHRGECVFLDDILHQPKKYVMK